MQSYQIQTIVFDISSYKFTSDLNIWLIDHNLSV